MADYEVAEYMVRSLSGNLHPALFARPGSGIVFDGVKKKWILEADGTECTIPYDKIYEAAFAARDQLIKTANTYRKKMKQPVLDLNTSQNWTDVEDSVQDACNGLEKLATKDKNMSGSLGKLKRAYRSLCKNAGAGQTAASLIPNDSFGFTSVLCGSLKAVFTGLRATGLYRQEVYRTLEDLPSRLKDLAADVKSHEHDEEIHRRAAALYVAAFNLLNHILHWFLKSNWITGVKIFADPLGFADRLMDYQAELKMASQSFEARLNKLSRDTEQETVQLQYWAAYNQVNIRKQLQTIEQKITHMQERESRVEILEKLSPLLNHVMDALQEKAIASLFQEQPARVPDIDPESILAHFLYERNLVPEDSATLAKRSKHLRARSRDASRLIALQNNPRLRAWLTVDEPSLLLLNGRADPQPDSDVSLFTSKLYQQLLAHHQIHTGQDVHRAHIIPLAFFCGQHSDWQLDSNGAPGELAMNLLLQLIDLGRKAIDPAVLQHCYEHLRPGDIASILSMFEALISSLRPNVVVIIIVDGLRFFAQPRERCHGTREVVTRLVDIYRSMSDGNASLKILFASPTRSEFVQDVFIDDEILELPRDLPGGMSKSPLRQRRILEDDV